MPFLSMIPWRLVGILALIAGVWFHGWNTRDKRAIRENLQVELDARDAADKAEVHIREKADETIKKLTTEKAGIAARLDATVARLRDNGAPRLPEAARTACIGATGAELSGPDGSVLAEIAARANRFRADLATCEKLYNNARKALNGSSKPEP